MVGCYRYIVAFAVGEDSVTRQVLREASKLCISRVMAVIFKGFLTKYSPVTEMKRPVGGPRKAPPSAAQSKTATTRLGRPTGYFFEARKILLAHPL